MKLQQTGNVAYHKRRNRWKQSPAVRNTTKDREQDPNPPQKLQFLKWSLEAGYKNVLYYNCKGDSFLYHLLKAFTYEC